MTKRCGRRTNTSSRFSSSKQRTSSSPSQTPPSPRNDPPSTPDVDYSTDDDPTYDIHGESETTSSSAIILVACALFNDQGLYVRWGIKMEYTRRVGNNAGRNGSSQWKGTKGSSVCKASERAVFLAQHAGSAVCRSRGTAGHIRRALEVAMGHWTH